MSRSGVWILRLAWRDSRGSRGPLLLSTLAVALGIAAMVAIRGFGDQLAASVDQQSLELLGADLTLSANRRFDPEMQALLAAIPGERVNEIRLFSMVRFPGRDATRLCNIRALSGPFPFYGRLETDPAGASLDFSGADASAIVEESLLLQYGAQVGDILRLGDAEFRIAAALVNISGETPATRSFMAPRVYIAAAGLSATGLMTEQSVAQHLAHYRLPSGTSASGLVQRHLREWLDAGLRAETVESRKSALGNMLAHLQRFLSLGGLAAQLLGGIGLASGIQWVARRKRGTVAVLRCLGADARGAFLVYVAQACGVALAGALVGTAAGLGAAAVLPRLLADFLPLAAAGGLAWSALPLGLAVGLSLAACFAVLPLLPLRRLPPLAALRPELAPAQRGWRDPLRGLVLALLGLLLWGAAAAHASGWREGLGLAAGMAAAMGVLAGVAKGLMFAARRALRDRWSLSFRQGIANLHRPGNQTLSLVVALGFGAFLLGVLSLSQHNLVRQFGAADRGQRPNLIFFDIEPEQVQPLQEMVREQELAVAETASIVTMRLVSVGGRSLSELRLDPDRAIPDWALFREYRATYFEQLPEREQIVAGDWLGRMPPGAREVPVSLEEGIAKTLGVPLGGRIEFDVQGVRVRAYVRSLRKVEWRQMRTNFFVIFPAGVLEDAPQHHALVTRAGSAEDSALIQHRVVESFPNVSAIDLRTVVGAIDRVLDRAAAAMRFMAMFTGLAGLAVLAASLGAGGQERREEALLWRALGATSRQRARMAAAEHLLLGLFAAAAGLLMATAASWALARWVFKTSFAPAAVPLLAIGAGVLAATLLMGTLSTRLRRQP